MPLCQFIKLKKHSLDWINLVTSSGKNQNPCFTVALGYVVASRFPLPPQEVDSITDYYRTTHVVDAYKIIGDINESVPFNIKDALHFASQFYCNRYQAAYPDRIPLAFNKESSVADFFGISKHVSKEVLDIIAEDSSDMSMLINGMHSLLDGIKEARDSEKAAIAAANTPDEEVNYVAE